MKEKLMENIVNMSIAVFLDKIEEMKDKLQNEEIEPDEVCYFLLTCFEKLFLGIERRKKRLKTKRESYIT